MSALPFEPATVLAPMEGVTNPLIRGLLVEQGGLGLVCTEFVRVTSQKQSRRLLRRVVDKAPGVPLCVQVMGKDVARLREAAVLVEQAGADVIDLNLGCPSPKAARGGVGAAMLEDVGLLAEVVSSLREVVRGPLSAKMRAGFNDASGAVRIALALQEAGVDWISVHPRRRCDQYAGVADWRITRTLVEALDVPVIGNGDCWYATDAVRMRSETGCAGVMIGRPALRNPWIFRQIADLAAGRPAFAPTGDDVVAWIERFVAECERTYARARVGKLKELVRWLGRAVRDERAFLRRALRAQSADEIVALAHRDLAGLGPEVLDLDAAPRAPLERSGGVEQPGLGLVWAPPASVLASAA